MPNQPQINLIPLLQEAVKDTAIHLDLRFLILMLASVILTKQNFLEWLDNVRSHRAASALSKAGKGAQMASYHRSQGETRTRHGTTRWRRRWWRRSAIIKAKIVSAPSSALVPKKSPNVQQGMGSGIISILETRANVKEIDDFYKGTVAAKREEIKKKETREHERKAEQETKLEKLKIEKKPNMKGLKMPKTGIIDGILGLSVMS